MISHVSVGSNPTPVTYPPVAQLAFPLRNREKRASGSEARRSLSREQAGGLTKHRVAQ